MVEIAKPEYISGAIRIETLQSLTIWLFSWFNSKETKNYLVIKIIRFSRISKKFAFFPFTRATEVNTLKALVL